LHSFNQTLWRPVVPLQLFFQWCPLLLKLWGWPLKLDYFLKIQLLTPPINPRLSPSYTKWIFLLASTWPRWFADSKNSISFSGLDPPKTQIFLMWWLEEPAISTHFYTYWMYGLSREDFIDRNWKCNHTTYM